MDEENPPEIVMGQVMEKGYSRVPVFRGEEHNLTGVLYLKDFLPYWLGLKQLSSLKTLIHKPLLISSDQRAISVLRILRMKKQHLALITDRKHRVQGLVTIQDLVNILVSGDEGMKNRNHGTSDSGRLNHE